MAFGVRKFSVRAQVMRRRDGKPTKVSIIPTKSMKRRGEKKVKETLTAEQKQKKAKEKQARELKRKLRAPRS